MSLQIHGSTSPSCVGLFEDGAFKEEIKCKLRKSVLTEGHDHSSNKRSQLWEWLRESGSKWHNLPSSFSPGFVFCDHSTTEWKDRINPSLLPLKGLRLLRAWRKGCPRVRPQFRSPPSAPPTSNLAKGSATCWPLPISVPRQ